VTTGSSLSAHRLLERGASELRSTSVEESRFEAELLLRHALGWSRESLLARLNDPVSAEAAGHYFQLVERRRGRVPIQHILGNQEFFGLSFRVTPAVLIPRPETEGVVEEALRELAGDSRTAVGRRIADVGCGSGCIGIALARELPEADVIAIDISPAALAVARENTIRHEVEGRVELVLGDLLEPLVERGSRVDAVVSNPPYVVDAEIESLAPEVAEHEPRTALAGGGEDGLSVVARLLAQANEALKEGGLLFMEIGQGQDRRVAELASEAGLELLRIVPDLSGIPRIVVARRPSSRRASTSEP
jgi:release factor glutamine methyltransferase